MKTLIYLILFLLSLPLMAAPAAVINEDGSFKLSDQALKTMGVVFQTLEKSGPWTVPKEAIVKIKFTEGVYRLYEGDITFVIAKTLQSSGAYVTISSPDLEPGDAVAVKGTTLLRLAEADLNSDTVDACAH